METRRPPCGGPRRWWRQVLALICIAATSTTCLIAAGTRVASATPTNALADRAVTVARESGSPTFLASLTEEERAWLRAHPVIRVVQDPSWPPIEFADEKGNPTGMTNDYVTLIEQRLGLKFEPVLHLTWQEAYAQLQRGEIDMTTTVAETPERLKFWAFTKPYMNIPIVIAGPQSLTYIANLHELAGKRVGVVDGYAVNDWIPRDFPEIKLVRVKSSLDGLARLGRGELDVFVDSLVTISYYQAKGEILNLKIAGATPYYNAQCMAVRKDWAPLAGILQKAIDSISELERDEIFRRWLPMRYEHGFDYSLFWRALAIFTVILLGLWLWNRRLMREIKARKHAQTALISAKDHLQTTLNAIPDLLFEVDIDGHLYDYHSHQADLLAAPPEIFLGKSLAQVLPAAANEACLRALRQASIDGYSSGISYSLTLPTGDYWFELSIAAMAETKDHKRHYIVLARNITERKHAIEAQRQIAERLALATRASGVGIWDYDLIHNQLTWDAAMFDLYGITPEQFSGNYEAWRQSILPEDQARCDLEVEAALTGEKELDSEFRVQWPDAQIRCIRAMAIVQRDHQGKPIRMIGTNWDITSQKQAECDLLSSLREKTALLNEVHHRVKNNLQVITSLLRLEAGRNEHAAIKAVLEDMQARIRAIALLHDTICRTGAFAAIDLGSYIGQVATQSLNPMLAAPGSIQLRLELGAVKVGLDQASPCGLLVSELISNCLKHGFADGRAGEIGISLSPIDADGQWRLRVSDNGIGLATEFETIRQQSLGLQLVAGLAKQMGGTLDIGPGPQAVFTVDFKAEKPVLMDDYFA